MIYNDRIYNKNCTNPLSVSQRCSKEYLWSLFIIFSVFDCVANEQNKQTQNLEQVHLSSVATN